MLVQEQVPAVECIRESCEMNQLRTVTRCLHRANTMSSALEVLGMSLPYSSSTPALYPGGRSRFSIFVPVLMHQNTKRKRKNVTELPNI